MFVLQVVSGEEEAIRTQLRRKNYETLLPVADRQIRIRGRWRRERRKLMPGYLFRDQPELTSDDYFRLKYHPGVLQILGEPTALPEPEAEWIRWLCRTDTVPLTTVCKEGDTVRIMDGPLRGMEGQIEKIDLRSRKATLKLTTLDITHHITLGLNVLTTV